MKERIIAGICMREEEKLVFFVAYILAFFSLSSLYCRVLYANILYCIPHDSQTLTAH